MILALTVACEIGFWVAILGGLAARYLLGARRLGAALLACAPLIDLVLLAAVTLHLTAGATASWHHGLAALYIGFSVTYGHRMTAWADTRFARRFANGPAPAKPTGWQYTRQCWGDVARTLGAAVIAAGIIAAITWWVGDPDRTAALTAWLPVLGVISVIDLLWASSYTIWPRKMA
ncbi:hypothetical protein E4P41_16535 [Geodermatophilus sp. DF01-2]|uniref:hypothetical protein n=1 Tax=Geodermatophilus sp. DF01-2 TaxID=2559610 RepID=UPI0010738E9E|nr:hypothetical protein [Geodermatophilus sp. DF01_2]TFV55919.1 hypothetical protein E4P41_16535 [Geodermatophilus sp. DF01_2]